LVESRGEITFIRSCYRWEIVNNYVYSDSGIRYFISRTCN